MEKITNPLLLIKNTAKKYKIYLKLTKIQETM